MQIIVASEEVSFNRRHALHNTTKDVFSEKYR